MRVSKQALIRGGLIVLVLACAFGTRFFDSRVFAGDDGGSDGSANSSLLYTGAVNDGTQFSANSTQALPASSSVSYASTDPRSSGGAAYQLGKAPRTQYGIMYEIWTCLGAASTEYTMPNLAPLMGWFWHGKPAPGYYCNDAGVMALHAAQLRDAGIDFVFVDFTNWSDITDPMTVLAVGSPFQTLVTTWSTIKGAPKIVPVVPMATGANLPAWIDATLSTYPNLFFNFQGKPLWMSWINADWHPDPAVVNAFAGKYTIRNMVGVAKDNSSWALMSYCGPNFKASGGTERCGQFVANDAAGNVEAVPVTTAYQYDYMTNDSAVPKFGGKTFHQQMARMDEFTQDPPIVYLEAWNEWIAARWCYKDGMQVACATPGSVPTIPNGNPVLVDMWDSEYNRDIEPGSGYGDVYYKQMIAEVLGRKQAKTAVIGYVDTAAKLDDGSGAVYGWACSSGYTTSINVEVYANGPAGVGELVGTGVANVASAETGPDGEDIARMCQDGYQGVHRFAVPIPAATMARVASQTIYVRGISPVGKDNFMIANSGTMNFSGQVTTQQSKQMIAAGPAGSVAVYRFSSPSRSSHFYTANYAEGVGNGFTPEGIVFYLAGKPDAGMAPIYRCSGASNFVGSSCPQAQTDGVLGYAYIGPQAGMAKVTRLWSPNVGDYLLTMNPAEVSSVLGLGFTDSGYFYTYPNN